MSAAKLILPYPPSANRYWRHHKGRVVVSDEAILFRRNTWALAKAAGIRIVNSNVSVIVDLAPVATKRPSKSARPRCIDLDNALKVVLDALQGIAYGDDSQIIEITARRVAPVPGGALTVTVVAA